MRALDIENDSLRAKLMEHYLQLDAYPEVIDVLTQLKDAAKKPPSCRTANHPC